LYRNVIKMRLALTAYARTMQPLVMAASAPVVRHFLDIHAFHKEAPNVAGALRRFRARVVLIQKWWAQLKMIRRAYISLFKERYWHSFQSQVYQELAKEGAAKAFALALAEGEAKQAALGGRATITASKDPNRPSETECPERIWLTNLAKRSRAERSNGLVVPETQTTSLKDWQDILLEKLLEDPLPEWMISKILYEYIRGMQRSHRNRVQKRG